MHGVDSWCSWATTDLLLWCVYHKASMSFGSAVMSPVFQFVIFLNAWTLANKQKPSKPFSFFFLELSQCRDDGVDWVNQLVRTWPEHQHRRPSATRPLKCSLRHGSTHPFRKANHAGRNRTWFNRPGKHDWLLSSNLQFHHQHASSKKTKKNKNKSNWQTRMDAGELQALTRWFSKTAPRVWYCARTAPSNLPAMVLWKPFLSEKTLLHQFFLSWVLISSSILFALTVATDWDSRLYYWLTLDPSLIYCFEILSADP